MWNYHPIISSIIYTKRNCVKLTEWDGIEWAAEKAIINLDEVSDEGFVAALIPIPSSSMTLTKIGLWDYSGRSFDIIKNILHTQTNKHWILCACLRTHIHTHARAHIISVSLNVLVLMFRFLINYTDMKSHDFPNIPQMYIISSHLCFVCRIIHLQRKYI